MYSRSGMQRLYIEEALDVRSTLYIGIPSAF